MTLINTTPTLPEEKTKTWGGQVTCPVNKWQEGIWNLYRDFFGHESDLNYFKLLHSQSLFLLFWRSFYWYGVDSERQDTVFFF